MQYAILENQGDEATLTFQPTFVLGFYRGGEEQRFVNVCRDLKARFGDIDILGCSSDSNLYASVPHIRDSNKYACTFLCLSIPPEHYRIHYCHGTSCDQADDNEWGSSILFAARYCPHLETLIETLQTKEKPVFGTIAAIPQTGDFSASIYLNGTFYEKGTLIWQLDSLRYSIEGFSLYDFDPVGFELEITQAENNTILEIENRPALGMIEEMIGPLDNESIASYDHPFFLRYKHTNLNTPNIPLASIRAIDRRAQTIELYRAISPGDKIRLAVPYSREKQERKLQIFRRLKRRKGIAILFVCIAYKGHWDEMEPIYLMRIARSLHQPFLGFHTFGEIGPLTEDGPSLLQNQTITIISIAEKE